MTELVLYGIRNCNTVKQALALAEANGLRPRLHDYRKHGLDEALLDRLVAAFGWEALVNRQGMTWRKLDEADKADLNEQKARALMLANPSLIRRPAIEREGRLVGLGVDQVALS